jgi:hypothetical protein
MASFRFMRLEGGEVVARTGLAHPAASATLTLRFDERLQDECRHRFAAKISRENALVAGLRCLTGR